MYVYSLTQWSFFFLLYCVLGWCFESTYVSIMQHRLVNRGFLHGPYLPIYGSGAIMMLFVTIPVRESLILSFLAGLVGATALEYITGVAMEALFKVRYWDYSNQRFNFQGHICLSSSIAWGGFTLLLTRVIHKPIERMMLWIPERLLSVLVMGVGTVFLVDLTLSVRAAVNLREILVKLETAKKELELMQKRLDVILAFSEDYAEKKRRERQERKEDLIAGIEERFASVKNFSSADSVKKEIEELREKFIVLRTRREEYGNERKHAFRRIIRKYPRIRSAHFEDALEQLKTLIREKRE